MVIIDLPLLDEIGVRQTPSLDSNNELYGRDAGQCGLTSMSHAPGGAVCSRA